MAQLPHALVDAGGNQFTAGANSGVAVVSTPLSFGAGAIRSGALELSNVAALGSLFSNVHPLEAVRDTAQAWGRREQVAVDVRVSGERALPLETEQALLRSEGFGHVRIIVSGGLSPDRIPKHVGVMLDGNRRWARERGAGTKEGHQAGADNVINPVRFTGLLLAGSAQGAHIADYLADGKPALSRFVVGGYPKNVVIAKDGRIVYWRSTVAAWDKFESVVRAELAK